MNNLQSKLKIAQASTIHMWLKASGYHWNVEGPHFFEYHKLFEVIYDNLYGSIDTFSEQIRATGAYAPFALARIRELSAIEDDTGISSASQMIVKLLEDNKSIINTLTEAFDAANSLNEQGVMNFLADRLDNHNKLGWFLRASTKG